MSTRTADPDTSPARRNERAGHPPWLIGVLEAGQAVGVLALVALAAGIAQFFLFGGEGPAVSEMLRAAGAAWAVAFALPVPFLGAAFSLPPLLVSLVPACLLWRAGRRSAEALTITRLRGEEAPWSLTAASAGLLAVPLVASALACALASALPLVTPADALRSAVFTALALCAGLLGYGGGEESPRGRLTAWVDGRSAGWGSVVTRVTLKSLGLLMLAGVALLVCAVAVGFAQVSDVSRAYSSGVAGQVGLTVVQLAFLPVAAVWALSWASGAGFAIGAGTLYAPTAVSAGPLPAVPVLAAVPEGPVPWALVAAAVVVLVGFWAARSLALTREPGEGMRSALVASGVVVAACLLALWWLAGMSSGAIGPARLEGNGPTWFFPLVTAGELALGAAAALVHAHGGLASWLSGLRERASGRQ